MKKCIFAFIPMYLGCISPMVSLDPSTEETGPSADSGLIGDTGGLFDTDQPDDLEETGDTEDTQDTQDTHDTQDTNHNDGVTDIGLREMRNEYLLLDGSLALKMTTYANDLASNEFSNILKPTKNWGVGVTLAPFNAESRNLFFGGEEIELFSGHGRLLTVQIVEDASQHAIFTVRLYNVQEDANGLRAICAYREFAPDSLNDLPSVSDLIDGFQILILHRNTPGSSNSEMTLILQRTQGTTNISQTLFEDIVDSAIRSQDCTNFTQYMTDSLVFGGQTPFVNNFSERVNMVQPQPLRARVDDLMLFVPEFYVT